MNNSKKSSTNNVLSFYEPLQAGYEPDQYSYHPEDIPSGEYHVLLDFLIKARRLDAIELY